MNSVIIVAGGNGKRMAASTPKQFLLLDGKPILMHTIETFYNFDPDIQIILVLPEDHHSTWMSLCQKYNFNIHHDITIGGKERFDSVKNGLKLISPDIKIIAIHDGVRPLTSKETLERCFKNAELFGAAIPAMHLVDSIRHIDSDDCDKSYAEDRSMYRAVQTPQCFCAELLFKAYETSFKPNFTDDASVIEFMLNKEVDINKKYKISLVEGNLENIKITTPADLVLAEYYMHKNNK